MRGRGATGACVVLVALAGCSDYNAWTDAPREPPIEDGTPITGTAEVTYHYGGQEYTEVVDLFGWSFDAWAYRDDGSLRRFGGFGDVDGTFATSKLPDGDVFVDFGTPDLITTSERHFDLGQDVAGRPDRRLGTMDASLYISAGGLAAWQDTDDLIIACENFGLYITTLFWGPELAVGATSLDGWIMDWVRWLPLPDADTGDQLRFVQMTSQPLGAGNAVVRTATREYLAEPLTMFSGQESTLAGSFTEIPAVGTLEATIDVPAFAAFEDALPVPADQSSVSVEGAALVPGRAASSGAPLFDVLGIDSGTGLDLSGISYGNPYGDWPEVLTVSMNASVVVAVPDFEPIPVYVRTEQSLDLAELGARVTPVLSPPRDLRINGLDTGELLRDVTVVPEITWQAPEIGTPDVYVATLIHWEEFDGSLYPWSIRSYETTDTRLTFPLATFERDNYYTLRIAAIWMPSTNRATSLYRWSLPYALAEASTHVFVP